ncbi:MAG TPA: RidA family protein [Streptosporangiaceae bacterium]
MKTYLNPATMHNNPAFSQVVVVREPSATIYVGGQNAITKDGQIVGDTIGEQVIQALINLELALAAADATIDDIVHWTIWLVQGQDMMEAFGGVRQRYPELKNPPAISVAVIAALANPRFLVEIDAVAVR